MASDSKVTDTQERSVKDRNLDKIFWFKVIISLVVGLTYGILHVTGFISVLLFFLGTTILSFVYFKKIINEDEEAEYQSEVFVEGLNVAIPLFLLSWTISYTLGKLDTL